MTARATRVVRGTVAASIATFVAALSHGVADGRAASAFAVAVALTLSVFTCIALAGRRAPLVRLGLSVGLSQLAYHALFTLFPAADGMTATAAGHHATHVVLSDGAVSAHVHDAGMSLAHVLAGVVTLWALAEGERTFAAIVRALRLALGAVLVLLPVAVGARPLPVLAARDGVPALSRVLDGTVSRRGPPVSARLA